MVKEEDEERREEGMEETVSSSCGRKQRGPPREAQASPVGREGGREGGGSRGERVTER